MSFADHAAALADARRVWPDIEVPDDEFIAAVARADRGENLHTDDLYLAVACVRGDRRALEILEGRIFPQIAPSVARVCKSAVPVDEALQMTRQKLLLGGPDGLPKLRQYTGNGALVGWLRVVAVRDALALRRQKTPRSSTVTDIPSVMSPYDDLLKKSHARELKIAIEDGLTRLSVRERNMLRLSVIDGMTIDDLALLFRVHRATAARWLSKARESVLDHARARVRAALKLTEAEAGSLFRELVPEIELSLSRVLGRAKESS